mmetsp:Transcript_6752/g.11314  ORF Transcript_6752/g.11314 Transcript_6752/m.11314 type:complete len:116 (-) Transcript_6752:521-868(-)
MEGSGELTVTEEGSNKGNVYKGDFKAGKPNGTGLWISKSTGATYQGSFKEGTFHGEGTYTWKDGSAYVGSFTNDKFHGRGLKTSVSGAVEEEGMWWNDEFLSDMSSPVSFFAVCV